MITRYAVLLLSMAVFVSPAFASDDAELTTMLDEFLAGASAGDVAAHERFWSDDLVYTSSNGTRTNKAEIVESMQGAQPPTEGPSTIYTAEDVEIDVYGDTAIVAFRLVGTPQAGTEDQTISYYFNTGTFLKRDGAWQVVAWQATRIPDAHDEDANE